MEIEKPQRRRRTHSEEFKTELVRACSQPGVSVAGIALANGVNANLLRRWMQARGVTVPSRRQLVESREPVACPHRSSCRWRSRRTKQSRRKYASKPGAEARW